MSDQPVPHMPMPRGDKVALAAIGAASAFLVWGFGKAIGQPEVPAAIVLGGFVLVLAHTVVTMSLAGPLRMARALPGALWLSLPLTALMLWAGLGHPVATDVLEQPAIMMAAFVILLIGAPFLLLRLISPRDWLRYTALFDAAWAMHLRFLAGWLFVGLVWLVLLMSNALLELVRLPLLDWLLAPEWAGFVLTGLFLGIGVAVVHDLSDTVSPFILFRLLRILVPVVLLVLAVFVAALPFSGLSDIFGPMSAAGVMMGMVLLLLTLLNAAIDRSDERAVSPGGLRLATRCLAVGMIVLCGLAVWSVAVRVQQYGWTPQRVIAQCAATVLLAYGLVYALTALRGDGWMGRLRAANVYLAIATVAVASVMMTPLLNPYRIATASQVARFQAGAVDPDALPLWEMAHDWGHAGQAGLIRLETDTAASEVAGLHERIALARAAPSLGSYRAEESRQRLPERMAQLARLMPVRPASASAPQVFSETTGYRLQTWEEGCNRRLSDGRPGCVLIFGDFLPDGVPGGQAVLLYRLGDGGVWGGFATLRDGAIQEVQPLIDPRTGETPDLQVEDIARALDGDFDIRPSPARVLWLGEVPIGPAP